MQIDPESWDEWKTQPITVLFFKAMLGQANLEQQRWLAASWIHGQSDPVVLNTHRSRAQLLEQWAEITPEKIEEILE